MPQEAGAGTAAIYDLKGLNCPLPVLKARKRLTDMQPGGLLWLETTDPLAVIDIPAFCSQSGHRLVETAAMPGGHRFLVERGA
ncbi:sulfurtransferase TusA family protein [Mesorhizobium sp. UC22_110]|uniref:sulfurtransferase TusA family protein n=1 Tax=unclassified Mesorhizobium TaxID=325217 RepID=UPI00366B6D39